MATRLVKIIRAESRHFSTSCKVGDFSPSPSADRDPNETAALWWWDTPDLHAHKAKVTWQKSHVMCLKTFNNILVSHGIWFSVCWVMFEPSIHPTSSICSILPLLSLYYVNSAVHLFLPLTGTVHACMSHGGVVTKRSYLTSWERDWAETLCLAVLSC